MSKMLVAGQSNALTEFYRAYLAWVEAGADPSNPHYFDRRYGLCGNLCRYLTSQYRGHDYDQLSTELAVQFGEAQLDTVYPFNNRDSFISERMFRQMHSNPLRMQWVRGHV